MTKKHIVVLTTGGTIASKPSDSGRSQSGALSGEQLLDQVALPKGVDVTLEVISILQKPSNAVTLADLAELHYQGRRALLRADVDGLVITHGTDTLEETAYFLSLTLPADKPCVITGSQRAPHQLGTDAFKNICDAIVAAASPQLSQLGCVVAFNESLFAARHARKVSSFQLHGFDAPGAGSLGYIDGHRLKLYHAATAIEPAIEGWDTPLPRVDLLPAYLDASPALLKACVESGAKGVVIDGLGRGHVPPGWMNDIRALVSAGVPVAVVSSCAQGPVNTSYEFSGSLADLMSSGVIALNDISARKARLALALLLSSTPREALGDAMERLMA
ncbi:MULTISPECIES: asparaginase [Halomonadaceae]|uniref:Asparaginase n=2 Tax=Vreelandella TaxID=3137766 RepID=A0A7Z0LRR0_9GAMM|nr:MULTISPECIES: asparaginase [Halomonas]NYS77394.1 asparaginase [Halomonas glaciei]|tara:strand:+ start:404 stop:1399 length:996 start_codon:yes stop_codon:yes gene_type:complete